MILRDIALRLSRYMRACDRITRARVYAEYTRRPLKTTYVPWYTPPAGPTTIFDEEFRTPRELQHVIERLATRFTRQMHAPSHLHLTVEKDERRKRWLSNEGVVSFLATYSSSAQAFAIRVEFEGEGDFARLQRA